MTVSPKQAKGDGYTVAGRDHPKVVGTTGATVIFSPHRVRAEEAKSAAQGVGLLTARVMESCGWIAAEESVPEQPVSGQESARGAVRRQDGRSPLQERSPSLSLARRLELPGRARRKGRPSASRWRAPPASAPGHVWQRTESQLACTIQRAMNRTSA